jgi:hypothetical protein
VRRVRRGSVLVEYTGRGAVRDVSRHYSDSPILIFVEDVKAKAEHLILLEQTICHHCMNEFACGFKGA